VHVYPPTRARREICGFLFSVPRMERSRFQEEIKRLKELRVTENEELPAKVC